MLGPLSSSIKREYKKMATSAALEVETSMSANEQTAGDGHACPCARLLRSTVWAEAGVGPVPGHRCKTPLVSLSIAPGCASIVLGESAGHGCRWGHGSPHLGAVC